MENRISKKEILGGEATKVTAISPIDGSNIPVELEPMRDYSPEKVIDELSKMGLEAVKEVEVVNPVTKEKSLITIDRRGTHEDKLAIMAGKYTQGLITKDQMDATLSLYLFERGKENTSMLVDLYRYKGAHTKETRAFTSQMRFDFEMFIKMFIEQMRSVSKDIANTYGIHDIKLFCKNYLKVLEDARKENTKPDFKKFYPDDEADCAHIRTMIRNWTEADRFEEMVAKVTEGRQREKGYGIYIDAQGKPYSIFDDQKVDEVVKRDIERLKELAKEQ